MPKKNSRRHSAKDDCFPCQLVEHDDTFSVILAKFNLLEDHLPGPDAGGYAVEKLARRPKAVQSR